VRPVGNVSFAVMNQRLALLFPPTWDPMEPYLALPALAAWARLHGVPTIAADENNAFFHEVLSREYLEGTAAQRLGRMAGQGNPGAAGVLEQLPDTIAGAEAATALLGDGEGFYDLRRFHRAHGDLARAMATVSAAWAPTRIDFQRFEMRYPFSSSRALLDAAGDERENPFIDFFRRRTIPRLREFRPTVAGISISSSKQLIGAFTLARLIREELPGVFVLVGGNTFTRYTEHLGRDPWFYRWVDSYVTGEGEVPLAALLEALEAGADLDTVPSLHWRSDWRAPAGEPDPGALHRNAPGDPLDLDRLPTPDFEGLPLDAYFTPEPVLPLETSRGCVWGRCAFCSHHLVGGAFRMRSPELVLEDIRTLARRHGARHVTFVDNAVPVRNLRRVSEGLLDAGPEIRWTGYGRFSKKYTPEFCRLLHDAGCRSLWFGLESANQRVLDAMDKGTTVELARQVSRHCFEAGIAADFFCMVGFPTEQATEALETFAFLAEFREEILALNSLFTFEGFALDTCSRMMLEPEAFSITPVERKVPPPAGDGGGPAAYDHDLSPVVPYLPAKGLDLGQVERLMVGFQQRLNRLFGRLPLTVEHREAHALLHRAHPEFRTRLARWLEQGGAQPAAPEGRPSGDLVPPA
jgi:radical SAM superfamily enzyme YgiQ (UPF0313 family)